MSIRRHLKLPAIALMTILALTAFLVACGGAQETAAPAAPAPAATAAPQVAAPTNTPVVRATNTPAAAAALPTPTQRASVLQATVRPTLAPQLEGELVTDRLILVADPPSLESMLDCEVTGSGVLNYRMSAEWMVDASRFDGSYEPMLATEWGISPDGRTWNFKLRQGVRWHDDWGVFTARVYGTREEYIAFEAYLSRADTRGIHSSGFYSQGTMHTFFKDRSAGYDLDTERTVRHEYVHYLADRFGLGSFGGPWFDEGLAEFLAGSTQAEGMLIHPHSMGQIAANYNSQNSQHRLPNSDLALFYDAGIKTHF